MKREIAEAWVKDLRTNPPQTTEGFLSAGGGHCCLGRLCLVLGAEFNEDGFAVLNGFHPDRVEVLTPALKELAGMRSLDGALKGYAPLTKMNDSGATFAEIADHIEKHWEDL